jgi:hypothetical protein
MAGYLDQYGKGDERREKTIKIVISALIALVVVGGPLLFIFHNFRQEQQAKKFFDLLSAKNYKAAYALWGCTDAKPCRGYPMQSFLEDWGPQQADPANVRISKSRSCGSGVILTLDFNKNRQEKLWVQRDGLTLSFPPDCAPGCPGVLPTCVTPQ